MRTLLLSLLFIPGIASAAAVSFDLQDTSAGVGSPFTVAVNATADEYVNAFDVRLAISEGLVPIDVSDGNSIILLWLDPPHFDETTRILSFSGIIPNGFVGTQGRLLTITFEPKIEGEARVTMLPESRSYAGEGREVGLPIASVTFPVVAGKENIADLPRDISPPEHFAPEVVSSPLLFGGANTVVFSTTDKGSGIAYYEVKESWLPNVFPQMGWKRVESPHPLADQFRGSYVYVRAVDKAGNERLERLPPEQLPLAVYIIPVLLLLLLGWWWLRAHRYVQT